MGAPGDKLILKPAKVSQTLFSSPGGKPMLPEVEQFQKWLRRKHPHTTTALNYGLDLELFFAWAQKAPGRDHPAGCRRLYRTQQALGRCATTINRRLAALRSFYRFLGLEARTGASPTRSFPSAISSGHGSRLPRDVEDRDLAALFDVITEPRDRAMFLLMLRCGLRVGEVRALTLPDLYLHPSPGSLPRLWLHGKGGVERVVYLSAQPLAALQAWLAVRPTSSAPAVFLNRFGQPPHRHRHPGPSGGLLPPGAGLDHLPPIPPHLWAPSGRGACAGHHHPAPARPCPSAHHRDLPAHLRPSGAGRLRGRHGRHHPTPAAGRRCGMTAPRSRRLAHPAVQPIKPTLTPFQDWLPANQGFYTAFRRWLIESGYRPSALDDLRRRGPPGPWAVEQTLLADRPRRRSPCGARLHYRALLQHRTLEPRISKDSSSWTSMCGCAATARHGCARSTGSYYLDVLPAWMAADVRAYIRHVCPQLARRPPDRLDLGMAQPPESASAPACGRQRRWRT